MGITLLFFICNHSYADADALTDLIQDMTSPFPAESYDVVVGIDGTGFITGCTIAHKYNKGTYYRPTMRMHVHVCVQLLYLALPLV